MESMSGLIVGEERLQDYQSVNKDFTIDSFVKEARFVPKCFLIAQQAFSSDIPLNVFVLKFSDCIRLRELH